MTPLRALLVALATSLSFGCGSSTSGDGGKTPGDSGSAHDVARDVTTPPADAAPDATAPADASEASSDAPSKSDASEAGPPEEAGTHQTMEVTFYGWDDNSPPGNAISYPTIHSSAGGVGTYADPMTFASDSAEVKPGTRIYIPVFLKYAIMEDGCTECSTAWNANMQYRFDLWIPSNASSDSAKPSPYIGATSKCRIPAS